MLVVGFFAMSAALTLVGIFQLYGYHLAASSLALVFILAY